VVRTRREESLGFLLTEFIQKAHIWRFKSNDGCATTLLEEEDNASEGWLVGGIVSAIVADAGIPSVNATASVGAG